MHQKPLLIQLLLLVPFLSSGNIPRHLIDQLVLFSRIVLVLLHLLFKPLFDLAPLALMTIF